MAEKTNVGIFDSTAPIVMAFPTLFDPKAYKKDGKDKGDPKFGCTFVLNPVHPDVARMKAKMADVARARWGAGVDLKTVRLPLKNGDKEADRRKAKAGKDDQDFMRGNLVIKASSKFPPSLAVIDGGKIVELDNPLLITQHKEKFFFGAEVLAQLNFTAYEKDETDENGDPIKGITAYVNMVLTTGKGKRLSSARPDAKAAFSGYVGQMSAANPLEDADEFATL